MNLLLIFTAFVAPIVSLGINCRGSSKCGSRGDAIQQLLGFVDDINPCRVYTNGQHIACIKDGNVVSPDGGFCAFLQDTKAGFTGLDVLSMLQSLANRTDDICHNCGSVPVTFPPSLGGKNNPDSGILTVNFVGNTDNPCPTGLC